MSKVEKFKTVIGLSEKIPTQRYGNLDLGPYQLEFETILDKPLDSDSQEFKDEVALAFTNTKEAVEVAYGEHRQHVLENIKNFQE